MGELGTGFVGIGVVGVNAIEVPASIAQAVLKCTDLGHASAAISKQAGPGN